MSDDHVHVSDLQWDRLLAGELSGAVADEVFAAAQSCPTCAARRAELMREHDAFAARAPFALSERERAKGNDEASKRALRRSRWWLAAPALLAAAVLLLVAWPRSSSDVPGERPKGDGPVLVLEAGPRQFLKAVATGDFVIPGDYVQAGYTTTRAGFGAVLGRDGSGAANVYVPSRGDVMVALPAGTRSSFPESTELDSVLGKEILVVVWCETARPLAPLVAELRAHGDIPEQPGCWHRRVILTKGRTTE
jgi:hypothetical protein